MEGRIAALKRIRIQGLDSDGNVISRSIGGDRWITFETDLDGQRYVYHQGRWFNIGGIYLDMLRLKVERIFAKHSPMTLPAWPAEHKKSSQIGPATERTYNEYASARDASLLCLDRKLLYTDQHPRGIESCDLLGPNDELIHVKRLDDSVSASHLFNQAVVSAEALRRQVDAKEKFRQRIREQSGGNRDIPGDFRPQKVILAFGGKEATANALFTFSQVTLVRCAQRLGELEVELEIVEVSDSGELLGS